MAVRAKICGVNAPAAATAAAEEGAAYIGLVFYPPSPRALTPAEAERLLAQVPAGPGRVGLFVDPGDDEIGAVLNGVALDLIQLHGRESPARVADIRRRFGVPVIKAISVAREEDLAQAASYEEVADWLLFDAKAPASSPHGLPGGKGLAFDWRLMTGCRWRQPWILSGGLDAENVEEAVRVSGAEAVDVSTGVEDRPGNKNPEKIRAFLRKVRTL